MYLNTTPIELTNKLLSSQLPGVIISRILLYESLFAVNSLAIPVFQVLVHLDDRKLLSIDSIVTPSYAPDAQMTFKDFTFLDTALSPTSALLAPSKERANTARVQPRLFIIPYLLFLRDLGPFNDGNYTFGVQIYQRHPLGKYHS